VTTRADHWEGVYQRHGASDVSWYQAEARVSLALIGEAELDRRAPVIDAGGGVSVLVDGLLAHGYTDVTVVDLSSTALAATRARLGTAADAVRWMHGDVLDASLPERHYALWHDRAMFHFLTAAAERARYVERLEYAVRPGGHVVLATFAGDGPTRCSGLEVVRYEPDSLARELGHGFTMVRSEREEHRTPWGAVQAFTYGVFRKEVP